MQTVIRGLSLFSLGILSFSICAQESVQVIRGKVVDKESRFPIFGATVYVLTDTTKNLGASTIDDGTFRIEGVSLGRHQLRISSMGFEKQVVPVEVTSGKEVILNIGLEEASFEIEEVVISAGEKGSVRNDMVLVSGREFSVEESNRYAGSRSDPARMASNYAGVQGTDDSRNDIVVRGNSPFGVLWRVEGIDIPNPNHFAIAGSSGGPISIVNNKTLSNSDFFTGAFPAEYGNSLSAVFDLKLRNGNNEKHEFSGQFGLFGAEVLAEGPLSKESGSSYLATYRYATFEIFDALGINLGTNATPKYQDAFFKFNFPLKKGGNLALFGMGGNSNIDILISNQKDPSEVDLYGDNDRDQLFGTTMGVGGAIYTKALNEKTFIKSTTAISFDDQSSVHNYVARHVDKLGNFVLDSTYPFMRYSYTQTRFTNSTMLNRKIGTKGRTSLRVGMNSEFFMQSYHDSIIRYQEKLFDQWRIRWNFDGNGALIQPYAQVKHKINERLTANFGWHLQYFSPTNSLSWLEPRAGLRFNMDEFNTISAGIGMHSQTQPSYAYHYQEQAADGTYQAYNRNMGMSRSVHYILGYDNTYFKNFRIRSEVYYQTLSNVPVTIASSSYSLVNGGAGFTRLFPPPLKNTGTGTNYGIELTLEKFFSKNYFFLVTGSLFDSKYKGSDGVERNTNYNGNYALNVLGGTEFKIRKSSVLNVGVKVTYAGGKRFGLPDIAASDAEKELIYQDSLFNHFQFDPYFRADAKVGIKVNKKNLTHEVGIDLVNIFNTKNILGLTYAPKPGTSSSASDAIIKNYQLGFLPIFYYRVDFSFNGKKQR